MSQSKPKPAGMEHLKVDLDDLAAYLEGARGMEIDFGDAELAPHQLALLETLGVTPIMRTRIHASDSGEERR